MSAAHAEAGHHGAENGHGEESAIDALFNGIGSIIDSARIAVCKVYKGIKGVITNIFSSKSTSHGGHETAAHDSAKPDAHAAPSADHAAPAAHH